MVGRRFPTALPVHFQNWLSNFQSGFSTIKLQQETGATLETVVKALLCFKNGCRIRIRIRARQQKPRWSLKF